MKSKIFLRLITLSLCLILSLQAHAAAITSNEAKMWTQSKGEELLDTFGQTDLAKRYQALDKMFLEDIDLDYISKFVVGKYWRQMTPEQQTRYQQIFQRYALSVYKSFPLDFDTSQISFDILSVRLEPNYANVRANIHLNQPSNTSSRQELQNIIVEFRLNKTNGKLRIVDLKLGESSLILSYRSRFYEMIAQSDDDMEWFLEDLETITQSTENQNSQKLEEQQYL